MAIKEIVLHVGRDARYPARQEAAMRLAKRFDARVVGVHVLSYPVVAGYLQVDFGAELIEQQLADARARAAEVRESFDAAMQREGLNAEWRLIEGNPVDAMALASRYGDITVIGQTNPDDRWPEDSMPDELVMSTGRPLLVWPYVGDYPDLGRQVMVAWNGSREAVRALHDAMDFLLTADKVVVSTVNPPDRQHIAGADVAGYLARHGINAEVHPINAPELDAGNAILSAAADFGSDLLVIGAYGHSRLREIALGGVTRHVLQTMTLPVLMSH